MTSSNAFARALRGVVVLSCCWAAVRPAAAETTSPSTEEPEQPSAAEPAEPSDGSERRDEADSSQDESSEIRPPEATTEVVAEYTSDALREGVEGSVVLRLDIDEDGFVTETAVMEALGHGLNEAAQVAAKRVRFRPAQRGARNVASRILLKVDFRLPEPSKTGALEGWVFVPGEGAEPGGDVVVVLTGSDGVVQRVRTDRAGHFVFESLLPGEYEVEVDADGYQGNVQRTKVDAGAVARVLARLDELPVPVVAPPAADAAPVEVTVQGMTDAERLRQSAEAVKVVETQHARRESADMGEVLARTQGVGVRRSGGLGSDARFSLNGLTDEQIRFFIDGVPLDLAGYPFGVSNVPVHGVQRVEIYSGVVPIRLGADALGGAVNLVTNDDLRGTHAGASYELGSFDTHRLSFSAKHQHEPNGLFGRVSGFFDYSKNDYPIDVEAPNEVGQLSPVRVHRFHDGYRAVGVSAEAGVVDRPWAKRLLLRAFRTQYDNDYQHNLVMTVPYGEVTYGEATTGVNLRYKQYHGRGVASDTVVGYTYTRGYFLDVADCVYDWFGRCVRERRVFGETDSRPHDQLNWDRSAFARSLLQWRFHSRHALRLSIAPTFVTRTGDEREQLDPTARDPLTAERQLLTLVNGVEYETDWLDDRLENILFAKYYGQFLRSEEPRPGGIFRERDRDTHEFGLGNGLRYRFTEWLYAKASYEWATRLPRPDEVFGDNAFIIANLELEPERSHNGNLGVTADVRETRSGDFVATVSGFWREADQLIVLLGDDRVQSYQNVYAARSVGVEGALLWTSPGEYVELGGNATYQEFRNASSEGTFGDFDGDRIPNRPYLFGNASSRFQLSDVVLPGDQISFTWYSRYVDEYFRGWESIGLREFKQTIDSQLVHTAVLGYVTERGQSSLSTTLEVQNVTDEKVFDFFGAQRPGRALYAKMVAGF